MYICMVIGLVSTVGIKVTYMIPVMINLFLGPTGRDRASALWNWGSNFSATPFLVGLTPLAFLDLSLVAYSRT